MDKKIEESFSDSAVTRNRISREEDRNKITSDVIDDSTVPSISSKDKGFIQNSGALSKAKSSSTSQLSTTGRLRVTS